MVKNSMIRITLDTSQLRKKLQSIPQFMSETILPDSAEIGQQEILETSANQMQTDRLAFFPVLSRPYSKRKLSIVGNALPNRRYTGNFTANIKPIRSSKNNIDVTVPDTLQPQARGLAKLGAMFGISDLMKAKIKTNFKNKLTAFLK